MPITQTRRQKIHSNKSWLYLAKGTRNTTENTSAPSTAISLDFHLHLSGMSCPLSLTFRTVSENSKQEARTYTPSSSGNEHPTSTPAPQVRGVTWGAGRRHLLPPMLGGVSGSSVGSQNSHYPSSNEVPFPTQPRVATKAKKETWLLQPTWQRGIKTRSNYMLSSLS